MLKEEAATGEAEKPAEKAAEEAKAGAETPKEGEEAAGEGEVSADAGKAAEKSGDKPTILSKGQQKKADRIAAAARREGDSRAAAAEARAKAAEDALAAAKGEKPAKEAFKRDPNEPDPEKYDYGSLDPQYQRDVRAYDRKVIRDELAAEQQATAAKAKASETVAGYEKQVDALLETNDDYYEVVEDGLREGKWTLPAAFGDILMESAVGAQIAYHLAKSTAEATRIANLPAHRQMIEFGKLETKFEGAAPTKGKQAASARVSQADPPAEVVRGSGGKFQANPATTDFAAFERTHSHLLNQ